MKKNTLDKKLQNLRKELGQTIIVHIGIPANNEFEILGVDCCGSKKKNNSIKSNEENMRKVMEGDTNEENIAYIG